MKKWLSILLFVVMMISVITALPVSAYAYEVDTTEEEALQEATEPESNEETIVTEDTEDNGSKDLAPVGADLELAETSSDDYPYSGTAAGVYIVDDWNFYRGECTSFCAWRLNHNNGVSFSNWYGGIRWGNANTWDDAARNLGITVNNTPAVGSIAYWEGSSGSTGHVAWVSNVYNGTVDIEEYNYGWVVINGEYHGNHKYRARNIGTGDPSGYIHIKDINPTPNPSNAWLSCNKTVAVIGDSVTFTFGANDATSYTIGIDRDGTRIITEGVSSGKTYTFDTEGTYSAYVSCYNSVGYIDSPRAEFKVFRPCNIGGDFYANIYNAKSNLAVGADITNNVYLQTRVENERNQKWHFQRNTDGSYRITNVGQDRCLDVYGGTANFEENIQVWQRNDSDAQKWYIRHLSTGYVFVPKCNTSSAMDIAGGVFEAGTNIRDWRSNETNAQIFSIDYLDLQPAITKEFNGHKYELYSVATTWNQAYKMCEEMGGHLVTVSSKEENDCVLNLSKEAGLNHFIWLGGYANGDRKWFWVTDEEFSYTNWGSGEPNNSGGNESYLHMTESGAWNDITVHANANMISFVCEYEDNSIDVSRYSPSKTSLYNDSKYEFYTATVTWKTAKAICEAKGGHLVIINNSEENTFVNNLAQADIWMGITDNQQEDQWVDLFGNPIPYSNWAETQPDNHFMCENYGEMYKNGTWNDHKNYAKLTFVCEYENATDNLKPAVSKTFNGHKYELYDIHTSWSQAYKICEDFGGHLVTISSKEENDFVMNLSKDSVNKAIWLGGVDYGSEGKWYWVTAEPFSYTNWNTNTNEPNNTDDKEHFLNMWTSGAWNDMPLDGGTNTLAFVCEYEEFQVDETAYAPVKTVLKNNTLYEFYENRVNWTTAKAICEQKGGHLITIDSKAENDIAVSLISEEFAAWIGYSDAKNEGEWVDVFGNKVSYSNWTEGEPNNHWGVEHYAEVFKTGLWNDTKNFGSSFSKIGFICEYDNAITSIMPTKNFNELGHKYEFFNTKMTWKDAYRFCEKKGGHLVTINSTDEQEVVFEIQKTCSPYDRMWLGATDEYSEGTWKWITGEAIEYKNWAQGEPNDDNDEDFMMMYKSSGKWNDVADSTSSSLYSYTFICEYDNQLDLSQFSAVKTFEYDGNKYEIYSNIVDWQTAKNVCSQKGGHLVTIGSSDENNAIVKNIQGLSNDRYWIGITDVKVEGMWGWVNGETATYSNWNTNEPNNDGGMEDYGEIIAGSGKWNDMAGYFCIHRNIGFICEYEIPKYIIGDADSDGVVTVIDATQIQKELASLPVLPTFNEDAARVDGDVTLHILDATYIQKWLAKIEVPYPIGESVA